MDGTSFYCKSNIDLTEIVNCLSGTEYLPTIFNDPIIDIPTIYLSFHSNKTPNQEITWRIYKDSIKDIDSIDAGESLVISPIWKDVQSIFTIEYSMAFVGELSEMMSVLLTCYDGFFFYEGVLFNKTNITSLSEYIP